MEREEFISGYCRTADQSRMVAVEITDGELDSADCCFPDCVYAPNCRIAMRIRELLEETK